MQISAKELCALLNGLLEGDPDVMITAPSGIEDGTPGTISFLGNMKYEQYAYTTKASILLVEKDFQPTQPLNTTLIRVEDVRTAMALLFNKFGAELAVQKGISEKAFIDATALIGADSSIGHFTVIEKNANVGTNCIIYPQVYIGEDVIIGDNVTIHPGARIYHKCTIGNHVILHSNVVIGADGFGFAPQHDGTYKKVLHIGNVVVEDNVEIGSNTTIDRATIRSTYIRKGVKLDNLIMLAHNVEVGENTVIAAQTGVAGSTKIGANCQIGGQVGIVGHLQIADGTKIQAQSGIAKSITKPNTAWYGSPAIDYGNYLKSHIVFKSLPEMEKRIQELEKRLKIVGKIEK
ncbi:MAG TPA: UDP-3-O-(3-hydroxymyristoyl)glucosamine N-acyltransferase [Saprospiraceae bacterium]|nr:UDP-3-O-(3-hydroxymyristoyl)glucosamine N-acyltransferase [Saprospiraceae bacterium]